MKLVLQIAAGVTLALLAMRLVDMLMARAALQAAEQSLPALPTTTPTRPPVVYLPAPEPASLTTAPKRCQITTADGVTHYCHGPLTDPR
jgi:hypothetical protein